MDTLMYKTVIMNIFIASFNSIYKSFGHFAFLLNITMLFTEIEIDFFFEDSSSLM